MASTKSTCTKFCLGFLIFILIVNFDRADSSPPNALMADLIHKSMLYRITNGQQGLSPSQVNSMINLRMMEHSRNQGSARRIALECSRPMKRGCHKLSRRCFSSILVKRSIDSQLKAQKSYWYDPKVDDVTEINEELESHHITKRYASRRYGGRIRISCGLCRQKCWK
ncbi:uncharacterized protein LOC120337889 [Styela clava]|uniref:uncharacterized protein LOC120337889 n=1 Tax=Styela clava TaxID=7725 RepID=UPI00193A2DE5|nr:uncharacterized protein LOC120337889 [Styela clava]